MFAQQSQYLNLSKTTYNYSKKLKLFMARVISADKCVDCGSCIGECPVEAISEGDVYTINADACIDCGACEATCPNEAISEA